jgi:hypothetical protein
MLLRNVLRKTNQLRKLTRVCFSEASSLETPSSGNLSQHLKTFQFSKESLTDFGDLPRGEIPASLKVDPKLDHVTLSNGAQVAHEHFDGYHTGIVC